MTKYAKEQEIEKRQAAKKGRVAAMVLHSLFRRECFFRCVKIENETQKNDGKKSNRIVMKHPKTL